jgi:hypothetical protein
MPPADFTKALDATNEVELGTVGRVSKRETTRPVWFVRRGDTLHLLPVGGSDSQWYKNMLATPTIHLSADGAEHHTTGRPITDPDQVDSVVDEFRGKYGASEVAKYYPDQDVAVEASLR